MDNEKMVKCVCVICAVVFVLCLAWYLLREPDIHDQRDGADAIRNELSNAGNAQRDAESHIVNAGGRIDRSIESVDTVAERIGEAAERIADSEKRNDECEGILADSERRIEESKSILQAVRSRAGQNGK